MHNYLHKKKHFRIFKKIFMLLSFQHISFKYKCEVNMYGRKKRRQKNYIET